MSVRPDEARVQQIGRELFERVARDRQAFYSADRWTAALFAWSLAHEDAKLQLFRFVDVLPALDTDRDLVRHLREYFEGRDAPYAALLQTALGIARVAGRLGDAVVGVMLRETVRRLARRFVAGSTPAQARRAALGARVRRSPSTSSARRASATRRRTPTRHATSSWSTRSAAKRRTGPRRRSS